jgi:small subunit ribosomal protein S9
LTEEPENRPESEDPDTASEPEAGAESAGAGDEATGARGASADRGADKTAEPEAEETADSFDEPTRAPSAPAAEAMESAPGGSTEEQAAVTTEQEPEGEEEYEPAPREKPEIPGADLEPVFIPQEEQYLDAEAQAAAEAEAEAAAERARAEAEDEQAKPIADAAIDLAAGARYTATGKRKTSVARVILKPGGGQYLINGRSLEAMFPRETLQRMIRQPLETVGYEARMDVIARMHGGGVSSQAGALRHGIARALIEADPNLRGELKRRGYLTRDPRVKERKKAGLKKARKRPQFSKR